MKSFAKGSNKKVRLFKTENEFEVNSKTAPEFMITYQKVVLLTLKEQGVINDTQLQMCLDRLALQLK